MTEEKFESFLNYLWEVGRDYAIRTNQQVVFSGCRELSFERGRQLGDSLYFFGDYYNSQDGTYRCELIVPIEEVFEGYNK